MELQVLLWTALSIGFIHTLIGPDHYLPFILIGRARGWSLGKVVHLTFWCGIGHVLSSVALGVLGVALGVAVGLLEGVETLRGDIASWLLIGFGVAYAAWGLRIGLRSSEHQHPHPHPHEHPHEADPDPGHPHESDHGYDHDHGQVHTHQHQHSHSHLGRHVHLHGDPKTVTPWALFIIFVLGPCEPLIPLLMYPAAQGSWWDLLWVTCAFGVVTVGTMLAVVFLISKGLLHLNLGWMERYVHALAGVIIALSGLSIKLLGL
jgi:nickel/cobalt exporter